VPERTTPVQHDPIRFMRMVNEIGVLGNDFHEADGS